MCFTVFTFAFFFRFISPPSYFPPFWSSILDHLLHTSPYTCHNTPHSLRLFFLRVSEHAVAFKQFSFDCFPINPAKVSHLPHHEPASSILHAQSIRHTIGSGFSSVQIRSRSLSTHTPGSIVRVFFFLLPDPFSEVYWRLLRQRIYLDLLIS